MALILAEMSGMFGPAWRAVYSGKEEIGNLWRDSTGTFHLWHFHACPMTPDGAWRVIGRWTPEAGETLEEAWMGAALTLAEYHADSVGRAEELHEARLSGEV